MFFNLCILIFYNAYPWRYFFYFEFRQKVHIVYFWPHLLFGAQNFFKNWNVVYMVPIASYYDGKVSISDQWQSYKTRKLKKCVFSIFFKSNLVVHFNLISKKNKPLYLNLFQYLLNSTEKWFIFTKAKMFDMHIGLL